MVIEGADRLMPFKSETPKSAEKTSFRAGSDDYRHPNIIHISVTYYAKNIKKKGAKTAPF